MLTPNGLPLASICNAQIWGWENEVPNYEWHHYGYTYDGLEMKMYVDGLYNINNYGLMTLGNACARVGQRCNTDYPSHYNDAPFVGFIDNLRVWNRSLSGEEMMNDTMGPATTNGLLVEWDGTQVGSTVVDISGNNNHGTMYNDPYFGGLSIYNCDRKETAVGDKNVCSTGKGKS